jgi:transposase
LESAAFPAEDIARGYKQLLEVERGWRDMKQVIDLRPVYHREEERIRAHVILCWFALLPIRIARIRRLSATSAAEPGSGSRKVA